MNTPTTDAAELDAADFSDWGTGKSGYVQVDFARKLESALRLAWEFLEDLRTSNPGYLRNLVLQDYERLNRLGEIPAALKAAGCTEQH